MRSQDHTFFSLIAGEGAGENYLSRLFQACFANSASFRRIALRTIWDACALPRPVPSADNWECDYQPPTHHPGGGRPDLMLRSGNELNFSKPIFLESKVDSPLTVHQLEKYKDHGTKILVAVTKNRPEVSRDEFQRIDAKSLRWQNFCRALRQTEIKGQKERFLCGSFAEYLEDADMAYREDITAQHLNEIGALFNKITSRKETNTRGQAFNYAHHCLEFLRDVRASVLDRVPKLKQWKHWGPSYYRDASDEDEESPHELAFSFTPRKWDCTEPYISGRLRFPAKGNVQWVVTWRKKHCEKTEIRHRIGSVSSVIKAPSGRKVSALDADKIAKSFVEAARKLGIV